MNDTVKTITTTFSVRERDGATQMKVDECKKLLDIVANEDVNTFFTAIIQTAKQLGYQVAGTPEELMDEIENKFNETAL